jgi:hypothetical protein
MVVHLTSFDAHPDLERRAETAVPAGERRRRILGCADLEPEQSAPKGDREGSRMVLGPRHPDGLA